MSLKQVAKETYEKNYWLWLKTRDDKYLNEFCLTKDEVEKIKLRVYKEYCANERLLRRRTDL